MSIGNEWYSFESEAVVAFEELDRKFQRTWGAAVPSVFTSG
jgi:hypothetical protein